MENKYEHIKFIIQRFDHYYDTVNSKGAFYIGLNTFIFGGVCVGYTSLYKTIIPNLWVWVCLIPLVICCFLSILFTIAAIKPYRKDNHANNSTPSLMYFEGIAKHEFSYLQEKINAQDQEQINNDALQQMHSLARGLTSKFANLSIASTFLQAQFAVLLPLFFIIIKNLK
jgi:hypothetical protein